MNFNKKCCLPPIVANTFYRHMRPGFAVSPTHKLWADGETIFWHSTGHRANRSKLISGFDEWQKHVSLKFQETNDRENASIRIEHVQGLGSWSYIGTDAKSIPPHQPTMNIGWDVNGEDPTVLHEIGHALGLLHEHQSPDRDLVLNEQKIYEDYRGFGWTDDDIRTNVLLAATDSSTGYDVNSIMHYVFPPQHITAPEPYATTGTPYNTKLSTTDIEWAKKTYPPQLKDPQTPETGIQEYELFMFDYEPGEKKGFPLIVHPGRVDVVVLGDGYRRSVILGDNVFVAGASNFGVSSFCTSMSFEAESNVDYQVFTYNYTKNKAGIVFWQGEK